MPEAKETTPDKEVKQPETPPEKKETAGDIMTPKEPAKEPEVVGLDKFLDEKKGRKDAEKRIKELEKSIKDGATKVEISEDLNAIAEEFDVDKSFLAKLAKSIEAKAKKDANDELSAKLKPLEEKERNENIDKAFQKHFKEAIEEVPEYKEIVNPDVIKALSLLPQNADKTFIDIIEDTYSSTIRGKRTAEQTTPRGGKEPAPLDYLKAKKDTAYFKEVMSDPKLKAEYNKQMLERGF